MSVKIKNSLFVIHPYLDNGIWVFDDSTTGLVKEPFIAGADEFIGYALNKAKIKFTPNCSGFNFIFSDKVFPDYNYKLVKKAEKDGGTYYTVDNSSFLNSNKKNELWLCPALNLYYNNSPDSIFIKIYNNKK